MDPPRSLIVTSKAHGELALAESLLRDTRLSEGAHLALPTTLFELNRDTLSVPAAPYRTSGDIMQAVDSDRPDLVFLFSAYLFSIDDSMSRRELGALLEHLRAAGCHIVTSDPFLGLAERLVLKDMDRRMLLPGESAWKRGLLSVVRTLAGSRVKVLNVPDMQDVTHLYPTGVPDVEDDVLRVTFFNPAIVQPAPTGTAGGEGTAPDSPRWVFVMSENDLHAQRTTMGLRDLVEDLLGMLRFALAEGRRPTLIAPALINELLSSGVPDGAEVVHWLPLAEFDRRIMNAEYVFYWNAFSYSQIFRIANDRPYFAFDRGFFSRAAKPLYEVARACHLNGFEPTYLDQRQLFSPYVLAHLAKAQRPALQAMREAWQRSPTPDALVGQLLE
jgi:hypothetical protein